MSEQTINASVQTFEHGLMIWRSDNKDIWVLINGGQSERFREPIYGHWPDNPMEDSVPAGRVCPINGFGKVWGNRRAIHDALGHALLDEQGVSLSVRDSNDILSIYIPGQTVMRIHADGTWTQDDAPAPPVDPPGDTSQYITRAEFEAAIILLRADMQALLDAHIERSLTIDEVADNMAARLKRPLTSAQLLRKTSVG